MFEMMHPVMSNYATLLCCGIEKRLSAGFVGCTKASYFSEVECVTKLVGFVACLLFLLLVWLICTPPSPIQKKNGSRLRGSFHSSGMFVKGREVKARNCIVE